MPRNAGTQPRNDYSVRMSLSQEVTDPIVILCLAHDRVWRDTKIKMYVRHAVCEYLWRAVMYLQFSRCKGASDGRRQGNTWNQNTDWQYGALRNVQSLAVLTQWWSTVDRRGWVVFPRETVQALRWIHTRNQQIFRLDTMNTRMLQYALFTLMIYTQ